MESKKAVVGILKSYMQAETTVCDLQAAGFSSNDISVLFPDREGTRDFAHEKNTKAPEGAVTGAGAGGDHFAFLRLFLRGVGDDDPALGLFFFLHALDDHAILQRSNLHG